MNDTVFDKIEQTFPAKSNLGKVSTWFAKDTLKSIISYSKEYSDIAANRMQPKSKRVSIQDAPLDIILEPNTFTEVFGLADNLSLYLNKPEGNIIPNYNAFFTLGNATEVDLNIESGLDYNLFWAHRDLVQPYSEYALYVNGNLGWLYNRPVIIFECVYHTTFSNEEVVLLGENSKTDSAADKKKRVVVNGVNVGDVKSYRFTNPGDNIVHFIFYEMPPLISLFEEVTNIKSVKFYTPEEINNVDISYLIYGNTSIEDLQIGRDSIWKIGNAYCAFDEISYIREDVVNKFLKNTTTSTVTPDVRSMFSMNYLLDCIELPNWDCEPACIIGDGNVRPSQIIFKNARMPLIKGGATVSEGSSYPKYACEDPKIRVVSLDKGQLPYKNLTFYSEDIIVASYTLEEALALTELPAEPAHSDYLTFNGWGITLEELKEKLQTYHYYNVIARYTNNRDYHFFDISLSDTSLSINFLSAVSGVEIDWGDGSEIEITNGSSSTIKHTYPYVFGRWDIKIYPKGNVLDGLSFSTSKGTSYSTSFTVHDKARFYGKGYYASSLGFEAYDVTKPTVTYTLPNGSQFVGTDTNLFDDSIYNYKNNYFYYAPEESETFDINVNFTSEEGTIPKVYNYKINRAEYINGVKKVAYASHILPEDTVTVSIGSYSDYFETPIRAMVIPATVTDISIKSNYLEAIILPENITFDTTNCPNINFIDNYSNTNITLNTEGIRSACLTTTTDTLEVNNYTRLKYFNTNSSNLQTLSVGNCYRLLEIPEIEGITNINISNCHSLKTFDVLPSYASCTVNDCYGLETINLYEGIEVIPYKFKNNFNLKSIKLPDSLKTIGAEAFMDCGIEELNFPQSLNTIGAYAFAFNKLKKLNIPDNVTTLGEEAFNCNFNLKEVILPDSIEHIPDRCFGDCYLENIVLPIGVKTIGYSAFESFFGQKVEIKDLSNWCNIEFADLLFHISDLYLNGELLTDVVIPDDVTYLREDLHFGDSCKSVTIGAGVQYIESKHISKCDNLYVSPENTKFDSRNDCNAIIATSANSLYVGCKNTIIPEDIENIAVKAFYHAGQLITIDIPESVTQVGQNAFFNQHLTGGEGITTAWDYAFYSCDVNNLNMSNLQSCRPHAFDDVECKELNLASITAIPDYTFYNAEIDKLILGENTNSIGNYAFDNCKMKELVCLAKQAPTLSNNAFESTSAKGLKCTLYYPKGSDYSTWINALTYTDGTTTWTFIEI